jgi:molybdopterin synthase sulfur carrier subunit
MIISRLVFDTRWKGDHVATTEAIRQRAAESAGVQRLTVRYFAWVREKVGRAEETLDVPADIATVGDLVAWLAAQGSEYASAFGQRGVVRAALDQIHVKPSHPLKGAREIAFFPPVTGG